jgi:uncharacterized protein
VTYVVSADDAWRTREAAVRVEGPGGARELRLGSDGEGRWTIDGAPAAHLDGCTDVDLEASPSTNTLPIRRLGLAPGDAVEVLAAWVRVPSLAVEPSPQRYSRHAESVYEYRSGAFAAEIEVASDGLVRRYGDIWRTVAVAGA